MSKLTVTLETVTPLFMGSAEQQAELRPAAFRGALRFWWRALWGGTHGEDLEEMRKAEAQVFGDTGQASGIVIRTKPLASSQLEQIDEYAPGKGQINFSYLFYGLEKRYKEKNQWHLKYRQSVKTEEKFELILSMRPGQSDDVTWLSACASLWLLTHLGGLGARSRRGAGSIQPVAGGADWPSDILPPLLFSAAKPQALCQELTSGIKRIKQVLNWDGNVSLNNLPQFDVLNPQYAQVYVVDKTWPDWKRALTAFACSLGAFRGHYAPDYAGVKKVAASGKGEFEAERAAFGLPLPFYFSSTGDKAVIEGVDHDRRSSPLLLRVIHYSNGQYGLVLTFFRSVLLPETQLKAKSEKGNAGRAQVPDYTIVDNYLNSLSVLGKPCYLAPKLRVTL